MAGVLHLDKNRCLYPPGTAVPPVGLPCPAESPFYPQPTLPHSGPPLPTIFEKMCLVWARGRTAKLGQIISGDVLHNLSEPSTGTRKVFRTISISYEAVLSPKHRSTSVPNIYMISNLKRLFIDKLPGMQCMLRLYSFQDAQFRTTNQALNQLPVIKKEVRHRLRFSNYLRNGARPVEEGGRR